MREGHRNFRQHQVAPERASVISPGVAAGRDRHRCGRAGRLRSGLASTWGRGHSGRARSLSSASGAPSRAYDPRPMAQALCGETHDNHGCRRSRCTERPRRSGLARRRAPDGHRGASLPEHPGTGRRHALLGSAALVRRDSGRTRTSRDKSEPRSPRSGSTRGESTTPSSTAMAGWSRTRSTIGIAGRTALWNSSSPKCPHARSTSARASS